MTTVDHGFDIAAIRADLDREDWEDDPENPGSQVRMTFLGTVFALTPSGKYYLPFACSNVAACPMCKVQGRVTARRYKRRTQKKHVARHARVQRQWERRYGAPIGLYGRELNAHEARAKAWISAQPKAFRMRGFLPGSTCTACGGQGSREAYLDEIWRETAEAALEEAGMHLVNGEGDPCDLFAAEYRDAPEDDDEDEGDEGDDEGDVDTEATEGDVGF